MDIKQRSEELATQVTDSNTMLNALFHNIIRDNCIKIATEQKKEMIDKFKQWLCENSKITIPEENRDMLTNLLKMLEE